MQGNTISDQEEQEILDRVKVHIYKRDLSASDIEYVKGIMKTNLENRSNRNTALVNA